MQRLKSFVALTLLGGLTVVLPIAILMLIFQWLFALITDFIQPLSNLLTDRAQLRGVMADVLVLLILLALCFSVGLFVKTSVGGWLHRWMDRALSRFAPGYQTIRDIVVQFVGGPEENSLFKGQVALVKLYGADSELQVTGIVTARFEQGYTVFVPTAPMPTSGMVYHVPEHFVSLLPDVTVEQAMRTVIACGAGSQELLALQRAGQGDNKVAVEAEG